ncbi:MAG: NADH-quinone oxidoreductase subunit G [Proteobacteria bacterium]|nr:NADH-quinone oxidoreductase subunit G [Pseudomonadota bacterium]
MSNPTNPTQQPAAKANTAAPAPASPTPAQAQPPLPPAPEGMLNVFVDGILLHVKKGSTVMQACTLAAKEIPHFCYHDRLSIAGNCRMCLVEIEGMPKPIASCHWPAAEGMKIRTDSKLTAEARKGTMELLLINHPLDCPICDQGGECALQDQAVAYGSDRSHFHEFKRAVDDKDIGHKIKTVMTRCIHCTRCVRFATELAGVEEFGATGRGENMQIGTYVEQALQSELAGNMIDLCPVGALTSAPYAFTARPWELKRTSSVDLLDAVGTPVTVDTRAGQVMRVLPEECDEINEEWLTDAARFSYDALSTNRLTTPLIGGKPATWPQAFEAIKKALKSSTPATTAGLMGNLQSAEDAYAFKAFLTQTLGTQNLDSRPAGTLPNSAFLTTPLKSFDTAEAVLLIGCNPRLEAPLLNIRLRRAALKRRMPVYAIGTQMNLAYPHTHLGETPEALTQHATTFKAHAALQILISQSVLQRPDASAILAAAAKLGTVNILADTTGRTTTHSIGALPQGKGNGTSGILAAWQKGQLKTLFIHGEDTASAMDVKSGKGTLIYLGTHNTPLAKAADVVLPTAAWAEKSGLYMNGEGRLLGADQATLPPLNAKEDWKIYRALSAELGNPLPFNTLSQLRTLIAQANPAFAPANLGQITAAQRPEFRIPNSEFRLSTKPFTAPVEKYYLRNEYLKQSQTMHAIQAESGSANLGPQPGAPMPLPTKPAKPKGRGAAHA